MCTSVKRCTGARKRDKAGEACYLVCHDRKGATSPLDLELSAVTSKGASARGDGTLWQKAAAVAEGDFAACMKQNCSCESVAEPPARWSNRQEMIAILLYMYKSMGSTTFAGKMPSQIT